MPDIRDILQENIQALMRDSAQCRSQNAAAKIAIAKGIPVKQTTLGTLLKPKSKRGETFPRLDTIEGVARLFNVSVAELLSKDLGKVASGEERPKDYAVQEPSVLPYRATDRLITETISYMEQSSKTGRAIIHDKARDIAKEHPAKQANAS